MDSIRESAGRKTVNSGREQALDIARDLSDDGMPVFTCGLDNGEPILPNAYQKLRPLTSRVDRWEPGMGLCGVTGILYDVIDMDPRNGGVASYRRLANDLGNDGPEVYWTVDTPSHGRHYYIAPLGIGTHVGFLPGLELKGGKPDGTSRGFVFLPGTERPSKAKKDKGTIRPYVPGTERTLPDGDPGCDRLRELIGRYKSEKRADAGLPESGRVSHSLLRQQVLKAGKGDQREALRYYVLELQNVCANWELIIQILLDLGITDFDTRKPWTERAFRNLLKPDVIADASVGEQEDLADINNGLPFERRTRRGQKQDARYDSEHWRRITEAQTEGRRQARARLASAKAPDLAAYGLSAYEELRQERKTEPPAVENMANQGHVVPFPSARKNGKTTLIGNLGVCGLMGEKFLGRFATYLDGARGIAAVNGEMTTDDYLDVWESLWNGRRLERGERHPFKRAHFLHCRDNGLRLNLLDEETCSRFVEWLRRGKADWLFIDPWKEVLTWAGVGMNDNDGVQKLLDAIRDIGQAAGLGLIVIPVNMPQNSVEGEERAKGAGELEDGADAMWRYSRAKGDRSAPRFLSVEGRGGVGLDDTEVIFGTGGWLTLGDSSRSEVQEEHMATSVAEALACELINQNVDRLNYGQLEAVVPATKGDKPKWIKAAVAAGKVIREAEGRGKPTWYSLPEDA